MKMKPLCPTVGVVGADGSGFLAFLRPVLRILVVK